MTEIWTINKKHSGFENNCGIFPLLISVESDQGKKINLFFYGDDICKYFYKGFNDGDEDEVQKKICKILNTEKIKEKTVLNILIESALKNVELQEQINNHIIGNYEVKPEDFSGKDFRKNT